MNVCSFAVNLSSSKNVYRTFLVRLWYRIIWRKLFYIKNVIQVINTVYTDGCCYFRAPFGLFYHAAWFTQPHHKEGFINFIDSILQMKDVWLVTNWQAIQWVRDPTPVSRLNSFQPFQCDFSVSTQICCYYIWLLIFHLKRFGKCLLPF